MANVGTQMRVSFLIPAREFDSDKILQVSMRVRDALAAHHIPLVDPF